MDSESYKARKRARRIDRAAKLLEEVAAGASRAEVARRHGYTRQYVSAELLWLAGEHPAVGPSGLEGT